MSLNFSIPGLQKPPEPEKDNIRVFSEPDGTVRFKVFGPVRNSLAPRPNFQVFIERADSKNSYYTVFKDLIGKYVFVKPVEKNYDEYVFSLNYKEQILDRGNYRVTVCIDDYVEEFWLTVKKSPKYGTETDEFVEFVNADRKIHQFGYADLISNVNILFRAVVGIKSKVTVENHKGEFFNTYRPAEIQILTESVVIRERELSQNVLLNIFSENKIIRERQITAQSVVGINYINNKVIRSRELFSNSQIKSNVISAGQSVITSFKSSNNTIKIASSSIMANPETGLPYMKDNMILNGSVNVISASTDIFVIKAQYINSNEKITVKPQKTRVSRIGPEIKPLYGLVETIFVHQLSFLNGGTSKKPPQPKVFPNIKLLNSVATLIYVEQYSSVEVKIAPPIELFANNNSNKIKIVTTNALLLRKRQFGSNVGVEVKQYNGVITRERKINSSNAANNLVGVLSAVTNIDKSKTFELETTQPTGEPVNVTVATADLSAVTIKKPSTTIGINLAVNAEALEIAEKINIDVEDWPADTAYNPNKEEIAVVNAKSNNLSILDAVDGINTTPNNPINLEYATNLSIVNATDKWTIFGSDPLKVEIPSHGVSSGDTVFLSGISGATNVQLLNNKYFTVTVVDSDTLSIDSTNSLNFETLSGGNMDVVEDFPSSIAFSTFSEKFAVTNTDTNTVTILDKDFNMLDIVEVGSAPQNIIYLENLNRWALLCIDSNDLYLIDSTTHNIINSGGSLVGGDHPNNIAYDPNSQYLCITTKLDDKAHIIDANNGNNINSMLLTDYPSSVEYITQLDEFIVTNINSDKISRIDPNTTTFTTFDVTGGPSGSAFSPASNILAVCSRFGNAVTLIDINTNTTIAKLAVGYRPFDIIYIAENDLFVTRNEQDDTLSVVNPVTRTLIKTISVQQNPTHFQYIDSLKKLIVNNRDSDSVTILDVRFFDD